MTPDQAHATIVGLAFVLVVLAMTLLWVITRKGSQ